MRTNHIFILLLIPLILLSCQSNQDTTDYNLLAALDDRLDANSEAVLDSLNRINPDKLSSDNKAYYYLIEIIAKDRTCYQFTSDSIITRTVNSFSLYRDRHSGIYARSLLYQGLVRFRMGIKDSTAYLPIKEAKLIFSKLNPPDMKNQFFCCYYLGSIHIQNSNSVLSEKYFNEALSFASVLKDSAYLYMINKELFWIKMGNKDYNGARKVLNRLNNMELSRNNYPISFYNMMAVFYQETGRLKEALTYEKYTLNEKLKLGSTDLSSNYYNLSNIHKNLKQLDSALYYGNFAAASNTDSTNRLKYFYYKNIGEISSALGNWSESSAAYKKAFEWVLNHEEQKLDTKIMELEKKYDLSEEQNRTLKLKIKNTYLISALILLLITVFILLFIFRKQKEITKHKFNLSEKEKILLQERQMRLEEEKDRTEQALAETQLILGLFQVIAMQNLEIKNFLYDLTIHSHIEKNPSLCQKIKEELDNYNQVTKISESPFMNDDIFRRMISVSSEDLYKLNKSDKILLLFLEKDVVMSQIAVLLNTTPDSIRNRKLKLKKKLTNLGIDLPKYLKTGNPD
ncbi:MAG: tetratricopeptide repeat protein [Paludibacteraceae bacterium]